jgi:hypothetical protein
VVRKQPTKTTGDTVADVVERTVFGFLVLLAVATVIGGVALMTITWGPQIIVYVVLGLGLSYVIGSAILDARGKF